MEALVREIKDVLESEMLITARLVDSVARTAQLAGGATPEMQDLFGQWVSLIAAQILNNCDSGEIDLQEMSEKIGVKETTLLSLLLAMQRNGELRVKKIIFSNEPANDHEVCDCLRNKK